MWRRLRGNKEPRAGHVAVVLLANPRDGSYAPYYVGQCDCGWFGDTVPDEATAFAEAHAHAESVDPQVKDVFAPDYEPE